MKTIKVTKRSKDLSRLLAKARRENLLLRSPTGAEFILAEIDDLEREIQLQRGNLALMAFLDRRARHPGTKSAVEVRKHLRLSRRTK